ncbi:MAG: hypothetical protein M1822_009877 [Bathelium mastoideum]|nr:MAG: hypothetical protein M1822_009877 [Bathelium mastoideum]
MCLVTVGIFNCGHGKVLLGHPATKKCGQAGSVLCVPEDKMPPQDLVSEYVLIEGPSCNRIEKHSRATPTARRTCELPDCDCFRPDLRCVDVAVDVLSKRVELFRTAFLELTKEYQSLDEDIAQLRKETWHDSSNWSYELPLSKLEEALEHLKEFHHICFELHAKDVPWDGRILNYPPDIQQLGYPRYRCFPGRTFNKAVCFSMKAFFKLEHLQRSMRELRTLQDARDARSPRGHRLTRRPPVMTIATEKFDNEELFAEHDEMAGVYQHAATTIHADNAAPKAPKPTLARVALGLPRSAPPSPHRRNPSQLSPLAAEFDPSACPISSTVTVESLTESEPELESEPDFETFSEASFDSSASSAPPAAVGYPVPHALQAMLFELDESFSLDLVDDEDEEDGDGSQPATMAALVATSEPLSWFQDPITSAGAIGDGIKRN